MEINLFYTFYTFDRLITEILKIQNIAHWIFHLKTNFQEQCVLSQFTVPRVPLREAGQFGPYCIERSKFPWRGTC